MSSDPPLALEATLDLRQLLRASADDLPADLGQTLTTALNEQACQQSEERLRVACEAGAEHFPLAEDHAVATIVPALRTRLQAMVQSTQRRRHRPSRRGRLDPRRLHQIPFGGTTVFRGFSQRHSLNTAVHLLLDASGSMSKRIGLASACCWAVAQALNANDLSVGITAFCESKDEGAKVMPLLRHGQSVRPPCQPGVGGLTPMEEALMWCLQRLSRAAEPRKIILLLTDGHPTQEGPARAALAAAQRGGVEVYGIGIQSDGLSAYLPTTSQSIDRLDQLPGAVFALLSSTLFNQRGVS